MVDKASEDDMRPSVLIIKVPSAADDVINEILFGIEEEGVPAEVSNDRSGLEREPRGETGLPNDRISPHDSALATNLAKLAADASALDVGIGASSSEVAVHHRDLPSEKPLFLLRVEELTLATLRALGANAARLVKGNPLVLIDDLLRPGPQSRPERPTILASHSKGGNGEH